MWVSAIRLWFLRAIFKKSKMRVRTSGNWRETVPLRPYQVEDLENVSRERIGGFSVICVATVTRMVNVYHGLDPWTFEALTWVNQHIDGIRRPCSRSNLQIRRRPNQLPRKYVHIFPRPWSSRSDGSRRAGGGVDDSVDPPSSLRNCFSAHPLELGPRVQRRNPSDIGGWSLGFLLAQNKRQDRLFSTSGSDGVSGGD